MREFSGEEADILSKNSTGMGVKICSFGNGSGNGNCYIGMGGNGYKKTARALHILPKARLTPWLQLGLYTDLICGYGGKLQVNK